MSGERAGGDADRDGYRRHVLPADSSSVDSGGGRAVAVACTAALAGLWHLGDIALLLIAAAASVGWLLLCARTERTGDHEWAPLALFGVPLGLLILLSGWGSDVAGLVAHWPPWVGLEVIRIGCS